MEPFFAAVSVRFNPRVVHHLLDEWKWLLPTYALYVYFDDVNVIIPMMPLL